MALTDEQTSGPAARSRRKRPPPATVRRRRALLLGVVVAAVGVPLIFAGGGTRREAVRKTPKVLTLVAPGHSAEVPLAGLASVPLRAAVLRAVPSEVSVRRAGAEVHLVLDRAGAVALAERLRTTGGRVTVPAHPVASTISAPVVQQALHNDCESAALEVLLATLGKRANQLQLQAQLPRDGPLDPVGSGSGQMWGDPERGFVGRADGGGTAGGYGVYERPIAALARRHGVALDDLTGDRAGAIYQRLLSGRAVLAWIALSDGPYGHWRSPRGRAINVNFGEHAVVLVGLSRAGVLAVVNPLNGSLEQWSKSRFERAWHTLGGRALAAPPLPALQVNAGSRSG